MADDFFMILFFFVLCFFLKSFGFLQQLIEIAF